MAPTNLKTKALVELDFNTHETIATNVKLIRKTTNKELTKERAMGIMVEERHQLQGALEAKKMSFQELLAFLTSKR